MAEEREKMYTPYGVDLKDIILFILANGTLALSFQCVTQVSLLHSKGGDAISETSLVVFSVAQNCRIKLFYFQDFNRIYAQYHTQGIVKDLISSNANSNSLHNTKLKS